MKIVNLTQGDDAWLAWRKGGITATDAAILLDRSPYKTRWRLWAEKSGFAREVDLSLNPLVRRGRENEALARKAYEEHTDDIVFPVCVESSVHPLLRASLDGLNSANEPVELKCPSDKVWTEVMSDGRQSRAFKLYYCQVQHQMLVTGAKRGWLVFWHQQHGLEVFEIKLNELLLRKLIQAAAEFWRQVLDHKEPPKDPERDLFIPEGDVAKEWIYAAEQYRSYQAELDELEARIKLLKSHQSPHLDRLKELMGEYFYADYAGVMVTRYKAKGRINYSRLLNEQAGNLQEGDVEQYRSPPSERYRVTVTESLAPRNIVDEEALAPLDEAIADVDSCFW